jgi:hypothetical protein
MQSTQLIGFSIFGLRSASLLVSYAASFYSSLVVLVVLYLSISCVHVDVCLYGYGKWLDSIDRIDQSSTRAWPQVHDMSNNDL